MFSSADATAFAHRASQAINTNFGVPVDPVDGSINGTIRLLPNAVTVLTVLAIFNGHSVLAHKLVYKQMTQHAGENLRSGVRLT